MMKLNIDNIGIVRESEIELNGITVITGHNNSGKTTVSKVLYSFISSVEDLGKSNLQDKNNTTESFLENMTSEIWLRLSSGKLKTEHIDNIRVLYNRNLLEAEGGRKAFGAFNGRGVLCSKVLPRRQLRVIFGSTIQIYNIQWKKKIRNFSKELKHDYDSVNYVNKKLDSILKIEFNSQVLHVNGGMDSGIIQLAEDGKTIFDVIVSKEGLKKREEVGDGKHIFYVDTQVWYDYKVPQKMKVIR